MYIKSIEIEGFKSYGTRTIITGFDPLFNAITGLNGSGKSNILDSICFVLGITNLSQVRASSLQELVYKSGQAGINKATVSITFDNNDPAGCPMGYQDHKEIKITRTVVLGGKNKYMINGAQAHNNRIHDFFQSIQLNVNNPHFLIMQGRITKVLNMKPMEILSMVEEAAGTRMYETKRENALKLMEKKEARLREINTILTEHITPTLARLKEERKIYVEYTKIVRELDHLSKLYVAWQYVTALETSKKCADEEQKLADTLKSGEDEISKLTNACKECDEKIKELERKKSEETGGKLQELEEQLKKHQIADTKVSSQLQNLKEAHGDETKKISDLKKNMSDDKALITKKEKELQNAEQKLQDLEKACEKDAELAGEAHRHFQAVSAGLSASKDGEDASLADQLMKATKQMSNAETEAHQAEMSCKHLKKDLEKKRADCKKIDGNYSKEQAVFQAKEKDVKKIEAEMSNLGYEEGKSQNLLIQKTKLIREIESLKERLESVHSRFPQLSFEYSDPIRNFDRSKVHGLVCLLVELKDPKTATALDLTAGGRLYNVVVDTEITGKLLLDKGRLKRRYTIIPLNKIVGRAIENRLVQEAEKLVGSKNVDTALSLVSYNPQLTPAMEYVFGSTFVCSGMQSAKKVTFANNIKKRCVTLDGEIFDPSGTLSGGSMGQRGRVLAELSQLSEIRKEIAEKQQQLTNLNREIQSTRAIDERYQVLKQQYELHKSEAEFLGSKLQLSDHQAMLKEVENLENAVEQQQTLINNCKKIQKESQKLIKELESKMNNTKSTRENELKAAEKAVSDAKKKADASQKKFKDFQADIQSLKMEVDELIKNIPLLEEQVEKSSKTAEEMTKKIQEIEVSLKEIKDNIISVNKEVKEQKLTLKAHSAEISKLHKEKDAMLKKAESLKLQLQQLEHDVSRVKEQSVEAAHKVKKLTSHYKWIEEEKSYFGVHNTEYDFEKHNPKEAGQRIAKLEEEKGLMQNNVNMRAQNMLMTVEEQYKELVEKREVVLNDKLRIEDVITELDDQKKKALKNACTQVNKDFGSIFSTLLPGTSAKLVPLDNKSVLEGLEFKVAFGDVWKESLTELSGGQRSLVALSLILSLLLFNPAPIYILDEVDAALDLSHTQNIGKMLRIHFKKSQFIVVSLKDGMFNNANVLFKTRFVDGMSTVSRVAHKKPVDD